MCVCVVLLLTHRRCHKLGRPRPQAQAPGPQAWQAQVWQQGDPSQTAGTAKAWPANDVRDTLSVSRASRHGRPRHATAPHTATAVALHGARPVVSAKGLRRQGPGRGPEGARGGLKVAGGLLLRQVVRLWGWGSSIGARGEAAVGKARVAEEWRVSNGGGQCVVPLLRQWPGFRGGQRRAAQGRGWAVNKEAQVSGIIARQRAAQASH